MVHPSPIKKKKRKKIVDQRRALETEEEKKGEGIKDVESHLEVDYDLEVTEKETGLILRVPLM